MSESTLKPFTGKLDENTDTKQQPTLQPFTGALDGEKKGFLGQAKDLGVSLVPQGLAGVAELGVGLSNIMSDGATGKILQDKGVYNAKAVRDELNTWHTDQYQEQLKQKANIPKQEIKEGDSLSTQAGKLFNNTKEYLKFYKDNPAMIANTAAESIAPMIAGGLLGRATGIANPVVAGAVGEGLSMTGSQAEQIRQNTVDGRLTADQSLASVGTGALGSLFSLAGGRVAQKLGIGDANTLLAGGRAGAADIANEIASMPAKSVPRKVIEGALHEGLLEELPQSVSEQILQNLALSKPWSDGIEDAAVMGTLAGMAMGAAAGPMHGGHGNNQSSNSVEQDNLQQNQNINAPQLGMRDQAIDGEYIPRQDMSSQDPQQHTTYTYDQQSTDAENLLGNNNSNFGAPDDLAGSNPSDIPPNGPNTPIAPNGSYFDAPQKPSEQMGIDPNNGPMSSAAALAVDSGASSVLQAGLAQEQQTQSQTVAPLSDAVPSDYRQLMESQNNRQSFGTGFENAALQQGNTQADNASKSRPQQSESTTPTSVKPTFTSNQAVGSVGYAQDVAKQAVQQYQGDKSTLEESKSSLTGKGPATDLLYYKNSPSFSDVQVEPNASGDKAIVKLTSAKTGRIEQREYPSSLIDFNNFLEGTNNNASKTEQDNLQNGNTETQAASESPTALDNAHQSTDQVIGQEVHDPQDQITALENQLSNEKNVVQKTKLRKQINELKANVAASAAKNLEVSAHTAATSPENNLPEPTQAQKEAGNYKKGHVQFHGLDISVENPRGSDRTGQRPDGTEWRHTMTDHYGYIKKTMGADGDHVDSYIGPDLESQHVYIVDQVDQKTGKFDEHKVMLGFNDQDTATKAYQANFDKGWNVGHIRAMTMNGFKQWLKEGDTTKPSAEFDDKTETVTTAAGRDLQVRPKVVEASDLIASNTSTGTVNEAYPQELQPRDRTRLASLHQINSIANDLKPNLLGKSPSASHGAPIVSSDNIVESGNGRTLAIAQAYAQGKAEHYRNWLKSEGHDITGMKHPVLVRERMTPMSMQDRMDFTKEANTSNTLNLSATEQAQTDAAKLNDVILSQYQGGDLTLSKNLGFVRQFMSQVIGHTEAGNMILDDGSLSQNGVRRIQGALLYKAYSDESLLHEILENTDSDIKAIGNALLDVSGDWALMREQSENGTISRRIDVTANLVEAVQLVRHARATGTHISEVIEQGDIFEGEIDPVTQDFIRLFFRGENYNRASGRDSVASALKYYVNLATETKAGENIFGEPELTGQELIRGVNEKLSNQEKSKQQQNLFTGERANDSNVGKNGTTGEGQRTGQSNESSSNQPKTIKESIEQIHAEKIRQKTISDLHSGVYGKASIADLENSLKLLNKQIQKAHKQSENEVINGKRSTRKAVSSGALDRFLKNRVDLETYIKARKSGEVEQRTSVIEKFSRERLKPDQERKGVSSLDTIFGTLSATTAIQRVLAILNHLKLSATQDTSLNGRITVGTAGIKGGFNIQVISSFDGLPTKIQQDATYQDENGDTKNYDVSGVWHNGTLYVVADQVYGDSDKQLTTFDAYEELLAHEIIGHLGVQQIFGQEYKTKLQQLYNALGGLEGIRKIAKENNVDMQQFEGAYIQPYTQAAQDGIYTQSDVQQALVGELFAFIAQNAEKKPLIRQKLKEVVGYLRQWLRNHGFEKLLSRYNDADLMMFLAEARKAVVDQKYFGKYKDRDISKNNGDELFSRGQSETRTTTSVEQIRDKLSSRFGEAIISKLEQDSKLNILETYDQQGIEGFYQNGKVTLIADALTDDSIIPTFLHELGGHGGFQNMMNQEQYSNLMKQFDEMVRRGHPVFTEAKRLAERESDLETQKLEYLPYLLSLASHMQLRNVIQKGALKSFIGNLISNVKAWLFDRLGMNINLNQDDILALAERMINKSANHTDQQAISFSEQDKPVFTDAFTISEAEQQRVAKEIDRLAESIQSYPKPVQMKMPPVLLALNGIRDGLNIQNLPLELDKQTLRKITGQVDGKKDVSHQLTIDQIKQLPNEFTDPLAVLHSDKKDGLIILTSMKDSAGNPVISAIHLSKNKGRYTINELATAFGKENFKTWLNKQLDNLVYYRNKKSQGFVRQSQLQKQKDVSLGVVHKDSASIEDSANSTLPSLQLRGVVDSKSSNQSVLSPDAVVNFFEKSKAENDKLYSRNSNYGDIADRISKGLQNLPKTGDWIQNKSVDWLKIGLGFLSRRHLTEIYHKILPQLTKYNNLAAQMDADKNDIAAEADNIAREWSKLKDEEALANVMHDATLAQIDPAKPYQQGDDKMKYQRLLHAYNNLSPEARAMYVKVRNAYSSHYLKVREAIRERILRSALSSEKKTDLLKKIEGSFGQIKGVYFPLARFGRYMVVVRNSNGGVESVSRAETKGEAETLRAELVEKYPQFKVDKVKLDKEFNASHDGVSRGFMSSLFDEVGHLGLDADAQAEFKDTLSQLYLSSMPDLSWAKHGIHRKGTAGFSQDARRAFAQNMVSGANYLAKLRYSDQLAEQLDEMQKYADEKFEKDSEYDQRSAQSVLDEMKKRHENLMNPKGHPLSSLLTSVGFMYYMGLSPAAAIVNVSQTALVAYPMMGAKWGFDRAGKELLKASKDFAKGIEFKAPKFSNLEDFKNTVGSIYNPDIAKALSNDELKAYDEAVKRGVIDVTQAHDLAGIAQGEDSKVMWYFRPAMRLASGMFHHTERFNREVTFIAAYRLASQAGSSHAEAFDQAVDTVYRGHFDYSSGNRARFMQSNVAKVVLLFKQYAQNMLYTLLRNAHQAIYALDPKEQKEARRALGGMLAMHALAAGALGLPITGMLGAASLLIAKKSKLGAAAFGVAALAALAGGGGDDDPYELQNVIRNWLADINPMLADAVFGGLPRAFSPVDLSGRVGLNNLIFPDVQDGLEGADWSNAYTAALLGPVAGIGTNIAKGMQQIGDGNLGRGIETILPVALKNGMKAYRFGNEGVLTKDKQVIQEDVSGVGVAAQAIGFSPSDVRTSMEGRSAIYQYKTKLKNHRSDLMRKWVLARKDDDSNAMDKVWAEILRFNENVNEKNPGMRITRLNLIQSYKTSQRKDKSTGDGGVYLTKREQGAEEQGQFAFSQ
ncbi:PLxRFG domain-containing protein [Acinetobacter sp. MB5]|uniref:PLxRFG domain-containing protein n=1 Tax=Acinetobacter sp. MB5 TaxID=2069438 RepID=UPI000DD04BE4|nr:PLxRFG domain-containing protein [Acinetobacter sp. MB5]